MRLFVAVEIVPAVAAAAAALIDELRARAARLAPRSRITWVTADRLHVTVRFIGHVDADTADVIRQALSSPLAHEPFDLTVAGIGTFPLQGPLRVVWAGLAEGRDQLAAIEQHVNERLGRAGIAPKQRSGNPHVTLGRVREAGGLRSAALLEGANDTVLGTTTVEAITLFESRLSPTAPTYVALQRTALS